MRAKGSILNGGQRNNMPSKNIEIAGQWLTIHNYKEPLKVIPKSKGFGYYGTLLVTPNGEQVQCHICGQLFASLPSHIRNKHAISAIDYKKRFDLAYTTALVSETERERMKNVMLDYLKTLTPAQRAAHRANAISGNQARSKMGLHRKIRLETKNKRGTCPDQLLDKILEVKKIVGDTPTLHEFIRETRTQRYKHLIITTFGSWKNALKMLNLEPRPNIQKNKQHNYYSNEQLLEYLRIFAQENNSRPTATDCRRGLLPTYEVFQRHFGSFEEARQLAGVYEIIN